MTDLGSTSEQLALGEQCSMDMAAPRAIECVITFAVTGGIFGVGRLAARLDELLESRRIGAWHIGPWVDWRQTAIRIKFGSVEDAKLSEQIVRLALQDAASVAASSALARRWPRNWHTTTLQPAAATWISQPRAANRAIGTATDNGSLSAPDAPFAGVGPPFDPIT
jgi:hypothetical protein